MKQELPVIACTLDAGQLRDRIGEFRAMFQTSLLSSNRTAGGAVLRFPLASEEAVRDLLEREKQCCAFWQFAFERDGDQLVVTATAPDEAGPLVERLLGLAP